MRFQVPSLVVIPAVVAAAAALTAFAPAARADFEVEGHISIGDDQGRRGAPPAAPPPAAPPPVYAPPPAGPPVYGPPPGPPPYAHRPHHHPPGAFRHDGTYVRMGLGGGTMSYSQTIDGDSSGSPKTAGTGAAFEFSVGGTLEPGVVIGGTIFFQQAIKPTTTAVDGTTFSGDTNSNLLIMGPFLEWYPNPLGGFHFGGFLGIADMTATDQNGQTVSTRNVPLGFGAGLQGGYDFWIGEQWSFGIGARVAGASLTANGSDSSIAAQHIGVGSAQLLLSILLH